MRVASIHVYPVKSLAGLEVEAAEVEPWGLQHDRRWVLLEPDGTVLTAREEHRLLAISARPVEGGIELTSRDARTIRVPTPFEGELVPTSTSRLESVRLANGEANQWLSGVLARPVRLAWLDDPRRRTVSTDHGGLEGDWLSLADAGPLLLASNTSLRQLNGWIAEEAVSKGGKPPAQMVMKRFRPNVVIDDVPVAFDEDHWRSVRIGGTQFRFAERCDRCVLTTIDPQTLVGGKQPLRSLAAHRQWDHRTWFAVRVIPTAAGVIRAGDSVEVLMRALDGHGIASSGSRVKKVTPTVRD